MSSVDDSRSFENPIPAPDSVPSSLSAPGQPPAPPSDARPRTPVSPPPPPPLAPPVAPPPPTRIGTAKPKIKAPQIAPPPVTRSAPPVTKSAPAVKAPKLDLTDAPAKPKRRGLRLWRRRGQLPPETAGEHLAEQQQQRRKLPSWLVSFIFHLALLLILALVPIRQLTSGPLTLLFGDSAGTDAMAEFELSGAETQTLTDVPEVAEADFEIDTDQILQMELPVLDLPKVQEIGDSTSPTTILQNIPFGIAQGLSGRSGALKSALLSKFGGNEETEAAVELGLKWLAEQQKSDGSWSLVGPYPKGGSSENRTAATALALNAFLGAGYTHKEGKYRENVKLGLAYLVRRQDSDGFFAEREPSRQQMYAQAIASICVTEAYAMTGDSDLRSAAALAMNFAEWSQSKLRGWRYEPKVDADLSVTGWFVMALITGKMASLGIDETKLNNVGEFLDSVSYEDDMRYAYSDFEPPSLSMTAEGLLCRIYLGWPRSHPSLLEAIQVDLLPNKPSANDREYSVYYWYYATQVLHHVGGPQWQEWNAAMRKVIPDLQIKQGPEAGSWDPSADIFGASGGRLYTTCLNLYCLEVYYRHLSIYDVE